MRKKIMSCFVALMFTFSFATNVLAAESTSGGNKGSYAQLPLVIDGETQKTASDAYAKGEVGRIMQMFEYKEGALVKIIGADFGITVLDQGQQRATFGYNENGTYTMTSFNLYARDLALIGDSEASLKNFLLSVGMTESQLQTTKYESDNGEIKSETRTDVSWLGKAMETLKSGGSLSIGTTAAGGSTLTVMNAVGKATAVYGPTVGEDGNPTLLQEYVYNNFGFISQIISHNWSAEISGLTEAQMDQLADEGYDLENIETAEQQAAIEKRIREINGKAEVKFVKATTTTNFDLMGRQSFVTDKAGDITTTFHYSSNGSLNTVVSHGGDGTIASTTHYVNNQPAYVTNDKGSITAQYNYAANGLLQYVSGFSNGIEESRTIFMMGQQIMTVDTTASGATDITYAQYIQAYKDFKNPNTSHSLMAQIQQDFHIKNIALFYSDLSNANLLNYLKADDPTKGFNDEDIRRMRTDSNGYSAVGMVTVAINTDAIYSQEYTYWDGNKQITEEQYKKMQETSGSTGKGASREIRMEKTTIKCTEINNTVTVYNHAAQAYTVAGSKIQKDLQAPVTETAESFTYQWDPAVVGTVEAYYDADGNVIEDIEQYRKDNPDAKIYAKVSAEGINMMDGSGFQPADGEEIMIDISSLSDDEISSLASSGRGMFMGDVNKSSNGQFTMTINKNYNVEANGKNYAGFVAGADLAAAVSEVDAQSKAALNGESKYEWMNVNTQVNRELFGLGTGFLNDWKVGWAILAGWNN